MTDIETSSGGYSQNDIDRIKAIAEETKNILEWIETEGIEVEDN
jgi:hypothetical protein